VGEVLRVNNLWKVFGRPKFRFDPDEPGALEKLEALGVVAAVRDVSLSLQRGEFFVVMGLSGSGKSTFIRCLLRLVEPTAGAVFVDGQEVTALNRRELTEFRREKVGMVFQHYGLLPHKTVLENAAFGLKLKGVDKKTRLERAEEALVQVGLQDWLHHYPSQLSGGMQQRVGIARALAKDPAILLMDEPFSGLDPLIRREMQDELLRLQEQQRRTVLFVTHDLDEALRLGDRMAVMRSGRFVQVAEPAEVLANPADDYVARFVEGARRALGAAAANGRRPEAGAPAAAGMADGTAGGRADGTAGGRADGTADGTAGGRADGTADGTAGGRADGTAGETAAGTPDGTAGEAADAGAKGEVKQRGAL